MLTIDFQALFFAAFRRRRSLSVAYKMRRGANALHDFVFLGSLLHDARLGVKGLAIRANRLVICGERDCWELPAWKRNNSIEYRTVPFRLILTGVCALRWNQKWQGRGSSWLDHLWLNQEFLMKSSSSFELKFFCTDCEFVVTLLKAQFGIKLYDRGQPFFWSVKKRRVRPPRPEELEE